MMGTVRKQLNRETNQRPNQQVCIAVYCNKGKHRSVAMVLLLHKILQRRSWEIGPVQHLSRGTWLHGCRGKCDECNQPPVDDLTQKAVSAFMGS